MKVLRALIGLLLLPLLLLVSCLVLAVWAALTASCLGPLAQRACSRRDAAALRAAAAASVTLVPVADGRRLAVRFSPGRNPRLPPVAIPNGLGATLVTIGTLHERLERLGFPVLTYDRAGVGLSDVAAGGSATAAEVVADMHAVLQSAGVGPAKWVLVGPSMGSIVAQCYIAAHSENVAGFLNMDGFVR